MTPKTIRFSELKYHWVVYFFALPSLAMIALFQYYPAILGVYHSFYRWNGADINEFNGIDNFTSLMRQKAFWQSFRVALILGIWNVIKMVPAVAVAVCINRARSVRMQFLYRTLFVAPMVIPGLIIVLIWRTFFFEASSGYLNRFLMSSGLLDAMAWFLRSLGITDILYPNVPPAWLGDGKLILFACVIWGFPWVASFAVLTHLAKLQGIPKELYEAADLDGANWWTKFTRLELPMLSGSINILIVLVIIDTIKDAAMILALAGITGGPGGAVTVPALFMLRQAFLNQQMGAACAVGIVLVVIVMSLKKSLDTISDWQSLTAFQKTMARLVGLGFAALMYWFLRSPFLAAIMFVVVIPFPQILGAIRSLFPAARTAPVKDAWTATPVQLAAQRRYAEKIASPGYRKRMVLKDAWLRISKHGFIWFILAFAYLPLYLMLIVSVKSNKQYFVAPAAITTPAHWYNWADAWYAVTPSLANSIFVATASTALTLVLALGAAYFFARVKVPGSRILWNAILILMMMPTIANMVPLFGLLKSMNLLNTLTALVAVGAAGGQVFAIFVLRNFVADIPQDLFEAAEIDGASHFRQMFTIVAPLSGPILGVVGLMHAVGQWNDFVLPLIIMSDNDRLPVMVQLLRMNGEYVKNWGPLMAGYAMASIPVIFLFIACMRLFTKGLTEGAVKG